MLLNHDTSRPACKVCCSQCWKFCIFNLSSFSTIALTCSISSIARNANLLVIRVAIALHPFIS
ncbi:MULTISPECIES: hypothetical protein [unclassified Microcoleus]|uniref:hypothetical protein n=1 Tax=unclassified Microcoleus TaxID=2642155 RepID=UPI0025E88ABB|nr:MULTISPECIES: hypothetical protein [unclassified Microcoleus]